jgi:hypothetical protein
MKILVDKMPEDACDCLFSYYDWDICYYRCYLQRGGRTFNERCFLDENRECPYLTEIK